MRFISIALWLLLAVGLMGQATPTATPTPTAPSYCAISGGVFNPDGSPFVGTINFSSKTVQVINGFPVYPTIVNTTTDALGNIAAVSLPQGIVMSITMCPSKAQASGCAAPFSAIVPFATTASLGQMAQGTNLTGAGALNMTTLNVSQQLNFPDGSTYTVAGHNQMKALGIGAPAPDGVNGAMLQATSNGNHPTTIAITNTGTGSGANETYYVGNDIPHYGALQLTNTGFTAAGSLVSGDEMVIGTNAANGVLFNSANASAAFNWAIGGTNLAYMNTTGLRFINPWPTGIEIGVQNPNTGTQGQANFMARSSDHNFQFGQLGSGWTANPFFPPDSSLIETDALHMYIGSYAASTDILFNITGANFARIVNTPYQLQGLQLPGYAGLIGNQEAGLMLGNSYFSATAWAGVSISGAAYYNQNLGQWIADGGAGSGVGMFTSYAGVHNFYYDGAHSSGQVVTWHREVGIDGNSIHVTHLDNNPDATPPAVSGGGGASLISGSRDTVGEIYVPDTSQDVALGFYLNFVGNANCITQDDGNYRMWVVFNKGPNTVSFRCQTGVGVRCGVGSGYVQYHCFGLS